MAKFTMGDTIKIFNSLFWSEKLVNISPHYTKRCRIATFWGGGVWFLRKVDLPVILGENSDLRFLRLQTSSIVISKNFNQDFLMKLLTKSTFLRKHTPQLFQFCICWYGVDS